MNPLAAGGPLANTGQGTLPRAVRALLKSPETAGVRAAERDGERVGLASEAGPSRSASRRLNHHLHLCFSAGAAAGHGEFDLLRRQLGDRDAARRRIARAQRRAPGRAA